NLCLLSRRDGVADCLGCILSLCGVRRHASAVRTQVVGIHPEPPTKPARRPYRCPRRRSPAPDRGICPCASLSEFGPVKWRRHGGLTNSWLLHSAVCTC